MAPELYKLWGSNKGSKSCKTIPENRSIKYELQFFQNPHPKRYDLTYKKLWWLLYVEVSRKKQVQKTVWLQVKETKPVVSLLMYTWHAETIYLKLSNMFLHVHQPIYLSCISRPIWHLSCSHIGYACHKLLTRVIRSLLSNRANTH